MRLCEVHCRSTAVPRSRVVLAARQGDRPGRGGGGGGDAPPPRYFTPPERLLSTGPAQEPRRDTVYTLRVSTALSRGASLTDPAAGVLVCLVAGDGSALLRRVPRINDPELTEQEVRDICSSIDDREAGANCAVALHAAASQRQSGVGPRLRFQEGAVDEVSFSAPELGPLAALIVGPEQGRFVCRESLGEGGQAAAYLLPVPADAVVYGSGDAAVAITKASMPLASPPDEQAAHLYSLNMQQYSELKGQLLAATAVLVALGSALAYAAGGRDLALPFALGGASGMLYQYMLQASAGAVAATDSVGQGSSPYAQDQAEWPGAGLSLQGMLANPAVRLAIAAGFLTGMFGALHFGTGSGTAQGSAASAANMFRVQQIVASLVGFLCYKAAVVGVAIIPPPLDEELQGILQADAGSSSGDGGRRSSSSSTGGSSPRGY
ncbi:hypothetical protein CHLNCDRAFT_135440 [Chlorella variabilis]|uniref:DUF7755 domain-containing protein n=1 Tax=Chlorella variabilis TaxID=554065 RepID=E1ZI84_CHLVA|nr:hypothetical protein CHLNCDRAFT_135440 [Chlorella variabilis]EFN54594.1 hypothetical protein CHLNCDRAFT_135440 [Chlorella variabilis]|eukprot:XP_005846696.1 hypothetical protein CHLNCDRAFT_135440 [Chlorella variabilis]